MLREAIEYALTPCPSDARWYGLLAESVALGARHRRQRRGWEPHVREARAFVAEAARRAPAGGRAFVAGSGRLIEIPLDDLCARFAEVVLADMVHPLAVRRAVRHRPNVRLLTVDIGGVLGPLRTALRTGAPLPPPAPPEPEGGPFDFVVSCNVLSQLPLLPLAAIERRTPAATEAARAAYATALATAHLDWLRRSGTVAALFTDTESLWSRENGEVIARDSSLWGAEPPPPDRRWIWDIAPAPEEDRALDLRHTVGAWFDINRTYKHSTSQGPDAG